jgi:hypothetical protein
MKCKICTSESIEQFSAVVMGKHRVRYFLCQTCFFLQTEQPYWLEEAYRQDAATGDTGIVSRSIFYSKIATVLICLELNRNDSFLDFGGGTGLFTRLMRDVGFDYFWSDPYAENIFAKGFEHSPVRNRVELITAFESFEHFENPMESIKTMMSVSSNILFSTETLPLPPPPPDQWHYYATHHGQHVSFYSERTFQSIAQQYGARYISNGSGLHLLTMKDISAARFRFIVRYGKLLFPFFKRQMHSRTIEDAGTTKAGFVHPDSSNHKTGSS